MLREVKNRENAKINVDLKDGRKFLGKDIHSKPFGDYERVVSFWDGDALMVFPMDQVKEVALYFES